MSAIGSIGPNLPHDLFAATGRYAGPLRFDPDRSTPRAGEWLESKFAPWAFALLETWAEGGYDHLESVVFTRADDTAHRLYYYICELRRRGLIGGPEPLVFDTAKIARPSSVERTTEEVRRFAAAWGVSGEDLELIIAANNLKRAKSPDDTAGNLCLLTGTAPPDRRLHDTIEAAGFTPRGRTQPESWSALGVKVEEGTGDPAAAIGRQLHAEADGPRSLADPAERLRTAIEAARFAAVILWRIEEDEAQAWHMPAQLGVLRASGLPFLAMTRRDWRANDGAHEEIAAFLGGVAP